MTDALTRAWQRSSTAIETDARRAAVAMCLNAGDEVLFVQRAVKEGDPWSGHIAFPGGHAESGESYEAAAIRETFEEVGLRLGPSLGWLDDIQTPSALPSRVVRPFVFRVPEFGRLVLQDDEVAGVLFRSLDSLMSGEGRSTFELEMGGSKWTLPCVEFGDGVRLWGLTLRVVDDLLDRLDGRGTGLARR